MARTAGGVVVLRIEDHDRERSRPAFEASILEDLEWLGFEPDEGSFAAFRAGATPYRQSDREAVYSRALADLRRQGLVYACRCSRREIEGAAGTRAGTTGLQTGGGETWYPGTCRSLGLAEAGGRGLRVRLEHGTERFTDGRLGEQVQDPAAQCGDLLVRDRLGQWTYQFAVTVDDRDQDITHVIRGEDLLTSTGRQIRLARLLGRGAPAVFLHHPLIYREPGVKLSKANRDTGVRDLRRAGLSPADVRGLAAASVGLLAAPRSLALPEALELAGGSVRRWIEPVQPHP